MGYVPVKLHDLSLGFIRRIMRCLLIQPPGRHLHLKLLYNAVLLVYLCLIFRWRYSFNYNVIYDARNDYLSLVLDLISFNFLGLAHLIVVVELTWKNEDERIDQKCLRIQYWVQEIGQKINMRRMRLYSKIVYSFMFLRIAVLLATTTYCLLSTNTKLLLFTNFYSEVALLVRCNEFALNSALVLAIYHELHEASSAIISQLETQLTLSIQRLKILQELHHSLWKTHRVIEKNFERSLIVIMLKYFVDATVMPYWAFLDKARMENYSVQTWCVTQELGKLLEISLCCWFCTRCGVLQRQFRAVFHGISAARRSEQLNITILRISQQLGQEASRFCLGGLIPFNNEMLGKVT
ncbi:hypothetical protein KR222_006034 [Zaprionus bogoriensis]|nr:hypothetical protein KR222_006034 [Zaprionus bogoriensis]